MFCIHCGAKCPDQAQYCASCGQKLVSVNETEGKETQKNVRQEQTPKRVNPVGKWVLFGAIALTVLFVAAIIMTIALPKITGKKNSEDGRITASNDSDSYSASDTEKLSDSDLIFIPQQKVNGGAPIEAGAKDLFYDEEDILLDGTYIKSAEAQTLETLSGIEEYGVFIKFNKKGTKIFRKATGAMIGEELCVIFNGEVISVPRVTSEITDGEAVISGFKELEDAEKLASVVSKQNGSNKKINIWKIFAIVFGCGILAVALICIFWRNRKLRSAGKIVNRKRKYVEEAQEFILVLADLSIVAKKLQELSYQEMKVAVNSGDNHSFHFSCARYNWDARLYIKGNEGDKTIYCFEFLNWQQNGSIPIGELYMNLLLTAIEKMFLSIDPDTQVQTRLLEVKTRHGL